MILLFTVPGCHVLCLELDIQVWQYCGKSINATQRDRRNVTSVTVFKAASSLNKQTFSAISCKISVRKHM